MPTITTLLRLPRSIRAWIRPTRLLDLDPLDAYYRQLVSPPPRLTAADLDRVGYVTINIPRFVDPDGKDYVVLGPDTLLSVDRFMDRYQQFLNTLYDHD